MLRHIFKKQIYTYMHSVTLPDALTTGCRVRKIVGTPSLFPLDLGELGLHGCSAQDQTVEITKSLLLLFGLREDLGI